MNLTFEIKKQFLVASTLFRRNKECIELKNRLWDKYRKSYELFNHYEPLRFFSQEDPIKTLDEVNKEFANLMKDALNSNEFSDLYKKTESYKSWLVNEWESKKARVEKELTDMFRIELPEQEIKILVVHPSVGGGFHIKNGLIFWGTEEHWPNYNVVYLAHEFLHEIFDSSDFHHALIELATDNELRIRLNGKGDYFREEEADVGHSRLRTTENALLPEWKKYLSSPKQNIYEFLKIQQRKTEYPSLDIG